MGKWKSGRIEKQKSRKIEKLKIRKIEKLKSEVGKSGSRNAEIDKLKTYIVGTSRN